MFSIVLKDVGKNRVTKSFALDVDSIDEAKNIAITTCVSLLTRDDFDVVKFDDGEYVIKVGEILFGSFTILKV